MKEEINDLKLDKHKLNKNTFIKFRETSLHITRLETIHSVLKHEIIYSGLVKDYDGEFMINLSNQKYCIIYKDEHKI